MLDALVPQEDDTESAPISLPAVIARHGHRYFKIKLGGDPAADAQRLAAVLDVLDHAAPGHRYTLDGNEQYADVSALQTLFDAIDPVLAAAPTRRDALLYIEQPLARDQSLQAELPWQAAPAPLLMDEADATLDAFATGFPLGWHGVSSKSCKGLYKAIVNRARCDHFNQQATRDSEAPHAFMSAEDLTCQAGLSVQQDLALAALLGLTHAERNGHHYASGFGSAAPAEQQAFSTAHPDLYRGNPPVLRFGPQAELQIDSLFTPGFAHRADPDFSAMQALADAPSLV